MKWSFRIGTIAGIGVRVHVTFLLFLAWALWQGLQTGNVAAAIQGVGLLLLVFACVVLHELGHAFAGRRYGIRTRDIVLLPIGGVARLERMPSGPGQEIVVALAGPAVNVIIVGVLSLARALSFRGLGPEAPAMEMLDLLIRINFVMIGFNLIPAFPMDGGRVLRAVLAQRTTFLRATQLAARIGQGVAILFAIAGLVSNYYMLLLVGLFVFLAAGDEYAAVAARTTMRGFPVQSAMETRFATLETTDSLAHAVATIQASAQHNFPVLEGEELVGVISRSELLESLRNHEPDARVGEIVRRSIAIADPREPVEQAFQRMIERRQSALPVVSDGYLVGMITSENVSRLLESQQAVRRHGAPG